MVGDTMKKGRKTMGFRQSVWFECMRWFGVVGLVGVMVVWFGCSSNKPNTQTSPDGGNNSVIADGGNTVGGDGTLGTPCVGAKPNASAESWQPQISASCEAKPNTCVGSPMPSWKLHDFQPQSCGYQQSYGLWSFRGKVTLVVLLAAWCGFCQAQSEKLERMRLELSAQGKDVYFLIVNGQDAEKEQANFVQRTAIPLFQDTATDNVWSKMGGAKDDMFLYDSQGYLSQFFAFSGNVDINLSTDTGYNNLKQAILNTK